MGMDSGYTQNIQNKLCVKISIVIIELIL